MAETGNWSPYYITDAGRNLRQLCIAEGKEMVFTRAVIGTGRPSDPDTIDSMSGLVAYAKDVILKKSYAIEANHLCIVRVDNSEYTQDVLMTETGIYAKTSDQADNQAILYGYAYALSGYILIPAQTNATNRKIYEITLDTFLSQSTDIQILFDSSSLFVSHTDLDDALESLNAEGIIYSNAEMPSVTNVDEALDALEANKVNVGTPIEVSFPLTSTLSPLLKCTYSKNSFNEVNITIAAKSQTDFTIYQKVSVGQMPVGFRPFKDIEVIGMVRAEGSAYNPFPCYVVVKTQGDVIACIPNGISSNLKYLSFQCSYVAAN